jgi:hypothetical protein
LDQDIVAPGLIMALMFVLLVAVAMVLIIYRWRRFRAQSSFFLADDAPILPIRRDERETAKFALKRPLSWLAVKAANSRVVQSALALHNPTPCSWAEGLQGDSEHRLFVSPPVAGWVLVIGPALPDPADDVDATFRLICDLSRKLGHVQFFHLNTILDHHAWARADAGKIQRAYAWAGRTVWNQGPLSPAEGALGMRCFPYGENVESPVFAGLEEVSANSEKVHLLAARWSLDPAGIDRRFLGRESGIAGEASKYL